MRKNFQLYSASYHLYKAATFLRDIKEEEKQTVLDMADTFLNEIKTSDEDHAEIKEIDEYAKLIKDGR